MGSWIRSCVCPCCIGQMRMVIVFICLMGIILGYCNRIVFNITLEEIIEKSNKTSNSTCPEPKGQITLIDIYISGGLVDWEEPVQIANKTAFNLGYFLLQLFAGVLCDSYGARYVLIGGFTISAITTVSQPFVISTLPWFMVFIVRFTTGVGQSVIYPGFSSIIARWIPETERAIVCGAIFSASSFGFMFGNTGSILLMRKLENWTIAYYLWGGIGLIYVLTLIGYVFSTPQVHQSLPESEAEYLKTTVPIQEFTRIPWYDMFHDRCMYGLIFAQIGHNLIFSTLTNNLPSYMRSILGFNPENNAYVGLMFITEWISSVSFGGLADYLINKRNVNVSFLRKLYTVISNITAGIFITCAGLSRCNYIMALIFLGLALLSKGIFFAALKVNVVEISVNHPGLVMSIVNGLGSVSGYIFSLIIGLVIEERNHWQWFYVFLGMFVFQVITSAVYFLIGSSDRRDWDYLPKEKIPQIKKANRYCLQMTPSDHELRLARNITNRNTKKEAERSIKEKNLR